MLFIFYQRTYATSHIRAPRRGKLIGVPYSKAPPLRLVPLAKSYPSLRKPPQLKRRRLFLPLHTLRPSLSRASKAPELGAAPRKASQYLDPRASMLGKVGDGTPACELRSSFSVRVCACTMTMDVNHHRKSADSEVGLLNNNEELTEVVTKVPIKRSFDVAFLMLPDDKLKQKQLRAARQMASYERQSLQEHNEALLKDSPSSYAEDDDRRSETDSPTCGGPPRTAASELQKIQNHAKYLHNIAHLNKHQQIFGDPNLGKGSTPKDDDELNAAMQQKTQQKSAFTKVTMLPKEATQQRMSPSLSLSPDLSYQNSLSPSPPILRHQYQTFTTPSMRSYQNTFLQENMNVNNHQSCSSNAALMESAFLLKTNQDQQANFAKMRPVLQYRPDFPAYGAYPSFPPQEMLKMSTGDGRNPTAAIFSSLLPPSLAALSLPAQNVCAKCNISFRMTSDLVYHMRSHHKNDIANDMSKRRREEKLKCPVCAESFRERHHLTRHMTAHQDKEGDVLDGDEVHKKKATASAATFGVFSK